MKNKPIILFVIVFCSVLLLPVSCKTAEFGFNTVDLNGMIYDFSNRPIANCEISLGGKRSSSSDINGRFTLPKVPAGKYTLTGYKSGFERFSDELVVMDRGQIIYIRLPSQNQLLNLVDEALTANNIPAAEELAERAYRIAGNNIESLFYLAVIKYKKREFNDAIDLLEIARSLVPNDVYIDKFITQLKEFQSEAKTES